MIYYMMEIHEKVFPQIRQAIPQINLSENPEDIANNCFRAPDK